MGRIDDDKLTEILERISALERRVFAAEARRRGNTSRVAEKDSESSQKNSGQTDETLRQEFRLLQEELPELLESIAHHFAVNDLLFLQALVPVDGGEGRGYHLTSLDTVCQEEDWERVARLLRILASDKRLHILELLLKNSLASSELVKQTGMPGGHLHHHLKDLHSIGLIAQDENGHYFATREGVDAFLTTAALYRRLSYSDRESFWLELKRAKGEE